MLKKFTSTRNKWPLQYFEKKYFFENADVLNLISYEL